MKNRYTRSFKLQAVEKALNRDDETGLAEIANSLGVCYSTLYSWISLSRKHALEPHSISDLTMTKEKRPQDWSLEERLEIVITCGALDEEAIGELCRERGIYPHHVKQWKVDFSRGTAPKAQSKSTVKSLRNENKALKKELNRKEKALAEAAALLVLQKKVEALWGKGEED